MNLNTNKTMPMAYGFLGAAAFWALAHSGPVIAQVGTLPAYLRLQATTPGTQQTGHSNISGTVRAGQFVGGGAGVSGVNADLIDGLDSLSLGKLSATQVWTGANSFSSFGNSFSGVGSSLTDLNATNVSTGTLNSARLPVPMTLAGTVVSSATLFVRNDSPTGFGVFGWTTSPTGSTVGGSFESDSVDGYGAQMISAGPYGAYGLSTKLSGVAYGGFFLSESTSGRGVSGVCLSANGTTHGGYFESRSESGVGAYAQNTRVGGIGLLGRTPPAGSGLSSGGFSTGAWGDTDTGNGVLGTANSGTGVAGRSATGTGVYGQNDSGAGFGVFAAGNSGASGTKSFLIDHPLDPENKYLQHYCNESPTPQNTYQGTVVTDGNSWAVVELPGYFESINKDAKVQLTVDDATADFVLAKVVGGVNGARFRIRTSKPRVKVYWMVSADRNDRWVQKYGTPVEIDKDVSARGTYQHPELYGKGKEFSETFRVMPKQNLPEAGTKP